MKRHNNALAIWAGACNPSAVALSIAEACQELRASGQGSTQTLCSDPAVRLMAYQLAYLTGVISGAEEMAKGPNVSACVTLCEIETGAFPPPQTAQA
jgi:hypothetical protein